MAVDENTPAAGQPVRRIEDMPVTLPLVAEELMRGAGSGQGPVAQMNFG